MNTDFLIKDNYANYVSIQSFTRVIKSNKYFHQNVKEK